MINRILAGLRRVTSSGIYDARIDGLRALAILPVVLFHDALRGKRVVAAIRPLTDAEQALTEMVPRGEAGVMLFFFISGFTSLSRSCAPPRGDSRRRASDRSTNAG